MVSTGWSLQQGHLRAFVAILPVILDRCHCTIFDSVLNGGNQLGTRSVEFDNRLDDFDEGAKQTVELGRVDRPQTGHGDGW
jgi:hypothetical protein